MPKTKFFALGGMMEIGKTTLVVEHKNEIVIVDAGIKFTNSMETGVEGIIPDYSYLKENEHKIKGLFITHGHEDHIGGVPYLVSQVKIPKIYAPDLAIAYLKYKIKDKGVNVPIEFEEITKEAIFKFDKLSVDFWTSQHSIPDSFGIRVKTPNGNIFDTGDFRFDYTPIGNLTDFSKLEKNGKRWYRHFNFWFYKCHVCRTFTDRTKNINRYWKNISRCSWKNYIYNICFKCK